MDQITELGWACMMILMGVQSVVMLTMPLSDGTSILKTYVASWAKTLSILKWFFMLDSAQERQKWLLTSVWMVLCVPGAILLSSTLSRMGW